MSRQPDYAWLNRASVLEVAGAEADEPLMAATVSQAPSKTRDVLDDHFPEEFFVDSKEHRHVGHTFAKVVVVTIVLNCFEIGAMCQWPAPVHSELGLFYLCCEIAFLIVYTIEVVLKAKTLRGGYFKDPANVLDFTIAVCSLLQIVLSLIPHGPQSDLVRPYLKLVNLLRLLRIFRILRLLTWIPELAYTIGGLVRSVESLAWVVFVLFLCIYAFAIYFVILTHRPESDYWKDLTTAMRTLTSVVVVDKWTNVFVPDEESPTDDDRNYNLDLHPLFTYFPFYVFALLSVFGITNIIIGVIVDATADTKIQIAWSNNRCRLMDMGTTWEDEVHKRGLSRAHLRGLEGSEEDFNALYAKRREAQSSMFEKLVEQESSLFPAKMSADDLRLVLDTKGDDHLSHREFCIGLGRLLLCDPFQQRVLSMVNQGYTRRNAVEILDIAKEGFARLHTRMDTLEASVKGRMDTLEASLKQIKQLCSARE